MRVLTLLGLTLVFASPLGTATPRAADCETVGDVQFVCGLSGPEDLAAIPGGRWIIASSYPENNGGLRLIDVRDLTTTILLPTETPRERLDRTTYASCPGPIASVEKEQFSTHGLYLSAGADSQHTLYVVHHGTRESIEVFDVDGRAQPPVLTWIGCAVAPEGLNLNSVVGLPDGGFAATSFWTVGTGSMEDAQAGRISGVVWEWHPGVGWAMVPGTETAGPNGLEISADGKWFYIGGWGSQSFIRVSRGETPVQRDEVPAGFHIDNLRAMSDGSILAAGQAFGAGVAPTSHVARVDPNTLQLQEVVRHPVNESFGMATTALQVGNELWVGSLQGDRVARFPAPPP